MKRLAAGHPSRQGKPCAVKVQWLGEACGLLHVEYMCAVITALAMFLVVGGCAESAEEDIVAVEDSKADDYYSNVAAEWEAHSSIKVQMTDLAYNDEAKRKDIVSRRLTAVGLYMTAYVTDKFRGIDLNHDGKIDEDETFFRNDGYGGFHAMVRTLSAVSYTH